MIVEVDTSNEAADAASSRLHLLERNHGDDWRSLAQCDACVETWFGFLYYAKLANKLAKRSSKRGS